jgi:dihydrofolate reductase
MGSQVGMLVTCDLTRLIGYDNEVPWQNVEDMRRFQELTKGSTLIMGYKTHQSFPSNRLNGITKHILDNTYYPNSPDHKDTKDIKWFRGLRDALLAANENKKIWILGGADTFNVCLRYQVPDFIELTILDFVFIPSTSDSWELQVSKIKRIESIPLEYMVEDEKQNLNDKSLFHRKYIRRPGYISFIENIRKIEKEQQNNI